MGRLHVDQLVQVLPRGVDLARRLRSVELRGVAADRPHLRLERLGDVDHEGRLHRVFAVGEGVDDLERPVGLAGRPVLREPGEVAGVTAQLGGDAVVGMPAHGEREDDDPRPHRADELDERRPRGLVVREVRVRQTGVEAQRHPERRGGALRLRGSGGGVAARARLALGEVQDADPVARPDGLGERAAAGELGVVTMGGDGEQVYGLRHGLCSSIGTRETRNGKRPGRAPNVSRFPCPVSRYSYLNASTGSSLAARPAGTTPKISPIAIETTHATTALHTGTRAWNWSATLSSSPIESPSRMPSTPPINVSVAASTRNCHRISRRVAPMALRTPISRVRSVTETIMIAMTPIPPTSSATLESTSITRKNAPVSLLNTSRIWSCVIRSKVSGSPGRSPRMRRSCTVTASIAWVTATPPFGLTTSHSAFVSS